MPGQGTSFSFTTADSMNDSSSLVVPFVSVSQLVVSLALERKGGANYNTSTRQKIKKRAREKKEAPIFRETKRGRGRGPSISKEVRVTTDK